MAVRTDSAVHPVEEVHGTGSPGRVAAGRGQPLPQPLSSFVGREREIGEVEALLGQARLVTLTGAGGSGKTRLAIEAARHAASSAGVEAAFVDLAPISHPALVKSTVATALGIRPVPPQTVTEALVDHLRQRRLLLVLDNVEQLLPAGATPVADLLSVAPDLRVLATSRASLHVRGEHEYRVDPLTEAEANDLFVDRARAVEPHFALTESTRAAIAEICERLDRLPLAIELAAAQARLLTAQALLRRLEQGIALPSVGPVDAPARQRTLHAAIAWSYGLLDRTFQTVLARASGFVGGFSAPAAEAAIPDPTDEPALDVIGSLSRLVDHNLVRVAADATGEPRFSLLETIREFALEQISEAEKEQFRERHAAYFVDDLARRTDYGAIPWVGPVGEDLDNLRAALEWAEATEHLEVLVKLGVSAWLFLGLLGHIDEAARWLRAAEKASAAADTSIQAALWFHLARHELAFGGNRRRAQELLLRSLQMLEQSGDTARTTRILELLSHVAADLGERQSAVDWMQRAMAQARALDDPVMRARFLAELTSSGHAVHDLAEMKALANEALRLGRKQNDGPTIVDALWAIGYVALAEGDASVAAKATAEALAIQRSEGVYPGAENALLALARLRLGDADGARSLLLEAFEFARRHRVIWVVMTELEVSAEWLATYGLADKSVACWAAVDTLRMATRNRTAGGDMGLYVAARARVRAALTPSEYEQAAASGSDLSIEDAIDFAIQALADTKLGKATPRASPRRRRLDLTSREQEVLQLLAAGRSDGQIADELFISKKTAAVHVANIKAKLGAGSRVEIVTTALQHGLVEHPTKGQPAGR